MSSIAIAGLAVLAVGGFLWMLSGRMARFGARTRPFPRPGSDPEAYRKRTLAIVRFVATAWVIMGFGLLVYSVAQGK
ncbi:hypothetical protein SAMN04489743_1256 [Pseudarthrobacter equi]|uniref:Uncharacterized protein n=1 Tax=Pseudarthrobacter equi TaxID=728066 RepID=A0A1H1WAQ1_9MICC|nr:hypothetical protein SAMN04489743_1256 [Pseudarthrobacter equi]